MDFEQILIRLGLDAKALTAGLNRTTSFVKGWATGLISDLQHHVIGRLAGLYIFERVFEGIKEKALFVQRTAKETGLSTNMVQGLVNELGYAGEGFEGMNKPLNKFNALIGQAKEGSKEARTKLMDLGIVTNEQEIDSLNLSKALVLLKTQLDKLGDASVRAAKLESIGKGMERLSPIFEMTQRQIEGLDKGNFATKMSPATLETFSKVWTGTKAAWNSTVALVANSTAALLGPLIRQAELHERMKRDGKTGMTAMQELKYIFRGIDDAHREEKGAIKETTEAYMERVKVQQESLKLENAIEDRTKTTVKRLAERGRAILGDNRPRGIESIHAITPAIANAMGIQNLEDAAEAANARGQFGKATELQSRADQLRSKNFSLKSTERDPTLELRNKLEVINETLSRAGIVVKDIKPQNH